MSRTHVSFAVAPLLILSLVACGDDPPWVGAHRAQGSWDVSGPFVGGRTLGDAVADLLVAQLVSVSGVPSALEEDATTLVDAAVRDDIKGVVDPNVPAELSPGGTVLGPLAASLATLTVESTIQLEEGFLPGSVEGTEQITAFSFTAQGVTVNLTPADLGALEILGEWSGSEEGDTQIDLEPHGFQVRFGELVRQVASRLIDAADLTGLESDVRAAVACTAITQAILGADAGLSLSAGPVTVSLSGSDINGACDAVVALIQGRALGALAVDAPVEIGGLVSFTAEAPSRLSSAADFGGIVSVAPAVIAPRLAVSFTTTPGAGE